MPAVPASAEIGARPGRPLLDYWAILHRRRRVVAAVAALFTVVAVARALAARPVYSATAQILVARNPPQVLEFKEVVQMDSQSWGEEYHLTQIKLLGSRSTAQRAVERLGLANDPAYLPAGTEEAEVPRPDAVVGAFHRGVKVRRLELSQIFAVTVEAPRPDLAAAGANAVAEVFIEDAVSNRSATIGQATSWLAAQIDEQARKVQAAEEALQRLAEESGVVNLEERRMLLEQKLRQLGTSLNERQARRLESEALMEELKAARDPEDLSPVMAGRVSQELRIQLAFLERRESELLAGRHLEQHPEVVKVRAQIAQTRARLAEEARRVVSAAENDHHVALRQERQLAAALEAAKGEALALGRRALRWQAVKRDLDAGQAVLGTLLARSKQIDVAQDLRAPAIRIVDRAIPPTAPVRPQRRRDVTLALLLGIGAGIALALLLEALDTRIRTPRDVAERLGIPVLAVVPEAPAGPEPLVLGDAGRAGPFAEAYRLLRSALEHACAADGGRVVAIASTAAGDGKTLTAVNLALALAARDEDVLLVDADLRGPAAHELLRGHRSPGFTDVLAGRVALDDALQMPNGTRLRLLAAGGAVPSPADAIGPAALAGFLSAARGRFRWTIVDTAPVGAVSDALGLAASSDAVVLVVAAEKTRQAAAEAALARLGGAGARVLGVLLNRARMERYPYDYGARFGEYGGRSAATAAGGPELAATE